MRTILILILFTTAVWSSCKPKTDIELLDKMMQSVPDTVISVEQMILVMTDIHLAESYIIENLADTIPQDTRLAMYYAQIFHIHAIELQEYKSSYDYYSNEPVIMNHIYQKITEKLNILESENLNFQNQNKNE